MSSYVRLTPKIAMELANPRSWVASIIPALFGIFFSVLLGYDLSFYQAVFFIFACVLMQASVNTLNDYYDFMSGADTLEDNLEKSDATLLHNNLNPKSIISLGYAYLIAGGIFGVMGSVKAGLAPVVIGGVGAIIVLLYSFGKYSISHLPIAEIVSGVTMGGLIPLGVAAAADGNIHLEVLIYAMPLILGIALIMMTNNGCDIEKDKISGRTTLPGLIGRGNTLFLYRILIGVWVAAISVLPIIMLKHWGIISLIIVAIAHKPFIYLIKSKLIPDNRIDQIKTIVIANIVGNGAYILPFAVYTIMRGLGNG